MSIKWSSETLVSRYFETLLGSKRVWWLREENILRTLVCEVERLGGILKGGLKVNERALKSPSFRLSLSFFSLPFSPFQFQCVCGSVSFVVPSFDYVGGGDCAEVASRFWLVESVVQYALRSTIGCLAFGPSPWKSSPRWLGDENREGATSLIILK